MPAKKKDTGVTERAKLEVDRKNVCKVRVINPVSYLKKGEVVDGIDRQIAEVWKAKGYVDILEGPGKGKAGKFAPVKGEEPESDDEDTAGGE